MAGVIVSNPEVGVESYGLTVLGVEQVTRSLGKISEAPGSNVSIYSSDFLRTTQTAKLAARHFTNEPEILFIEALRERYFGSLDGGPDSAYEKVWCEDLESTGHGSCGVESIDSVLARLETLITRIERENSRQKILLVSHGDVLNMLQTQFRGERANHHRSANPFAVGELRKLNPE